MAICHFSTSRCCFEKKACVVLSVAGSDGWMKNGNVALRFVGSEVIGQAVYTGSPTVHIEVIPKQLQIQ